MSGTPGHGEGGVPVRMVLAIARRVPYLTAGLVAFVLGGVLFGPWASLGAVVGGGLVLLEGARGVLWLWDWTELRAAYGLWCPWREVAAVRDFAAFRLHRRVVKDWKPAMEDLALTVPFARRWGREGDAGPWLVRLRRHRMGVEAEVWLPDGLDPARFEASADALTRRWGARAVYVDGDGSELHMLLALRDGLDGERPWEPVTGGAAGSVWVRLGRLEDGTDVALDLVEPYHLAIQGQTRSGKGGPVRAMCAGVAGRADVVVCGVDPAGGVLGPWSGHPGEHLRVVGTADLGAAADVLGRIAAEADARNGRLVAEGRDRLEEPNAECPLLLVVLDEYPGLLAAAEAEDGAMGRRPAERVAARIRREVHRLVQEGAKVNVRVVLVAQRADASIVGGALRSNFAVRLTMRVDNTEAVRMLHPSADQALCERVARFGQAYGLVERPSKSLRVMKADHLPYERYVQAIRSTAPAPVRGGEGR